MNEPLHLLTESELQGGGWTEYIMQDWQTADPNLSPKSCVSLGMGCYTARSDIACVHLTHMVIIENRIGLQLHSPQNESQLQFSSREMIMNFNLRRQGLGRKFFLLYFDTKSLSSPLEGVTAVLWMFLWADTWAFHCRTECSVQSVCTHLHAWFVRWRHLFVHSYFRHILNWIPPL